jgi:hypothetical protein
MRLIAAILLVFAAGCSRAPEVAPPPEISHPEAKALGDQHLQAGTLLEYETAQTFISKGWRKDYTSFIRRYWKGREQAGVGLELRALPDHSYRIGQTFDLMAAVTNGGDEPRSLNNGGNCGMTHAFGFMLIPPEGRLTYGLGPDQK